MFTVLLFLATFALASIASAGLIFSTNDLTIAQTVDEDTTVPPGTPAS